MGATKEVRTTILKFRYSPTRATMLQLIADAETGGNLSRLLQELADEKIEQRIRRKENAA